jgi:hypothetical protein
VGLTKRFPDFDRISATIRGRYHVISLRPRRTLIPGIKAKTFETSIRRLL